MSKLKHKILSNDTEIRAFMNRSRMDILAELCKGPATISQLGKKLGVHPANLTVHLRKLVNAGLAELVEKRDTGRNLEKYYEATAESFEVVPEMDFIKSPHKHALAFARSDISVALSRLPENDPRKIIVLLEEARISDRNIDRFQKKLSDLIKSFNESNEKDGTAYHLNISMYPGEIDTLLKNHIELTRKRSK